MARPDVGLDDLHEGVSIASLVLVVQPERVTDLVRDVPDTRVGHQLDVLPAAVPADLVRLAVVLVPSLEADVVAVASSRVESPVRHRDDVGDGLSDARLERVRHRRVERVRDGSVPPSSANDVRHAPSMRVTT